MVVAYGNVLMDWDKVLQYKHFDVGDGTHVHLWHDRWCGDHCLKEVLPILFECSIAREASVASMLVRQTVGEMRSWDVSSLLNFNDWEFEVVDSIKCAYDNDFIMIALYDPAKTPIGFCCRRGSNLRSLVQ